MVNTPILENPDKASSAGNTPLIIRVPQANRKTLPGETLLPISVANTQISKNTKKYNSIFILKLNKKGIAKHN